MLYVAVLLVGLALYCGWTGAAWTLNGPIHSKKDRLSYWGFVLSYLAGALIFGLGSISNSGGFAGFLTCVVLIELWTGIQIGRYGISHLEDNPGGFLTGTTLWLIIALGVAILGLLR